MKRFFAFLAHLWSPVDTAFPTIPAFEAEPSEAPRPNPFTAAIHNPEDRYRRRRQFARYLRWATSHEVGCAREVHRYETPDGVYVEEYESSHCPPRIPKPYK